MLGCHREAAAMEFGVLRRHQVTATAADEGGGASTCVATATRHSQLRPQLHTRTADTKGDTQLGLVYRFTTSHPVRHLATNLLLSGSKREGGRGPRGVSASYVLDIAEIRFKHQTQQPPHRSLCRSAAASSRPTPRLYHACSPNSKSRDQKRSLSHPHPPVAALASSR
jgi:hypothetical protein